MDALRFLHLNHDATLLDADIAATGGTANTTCGP